MLDPVARQLSTDGDARRRLDGSAWHDRAANRVVPHDHFVQFYERDSELAETVSAFIGNGLCSGATAIVVATQGHLAQFELRMNARALDLPALRNMGAYVTLDADDTVESLQIEGWPDASRFETIIGSIIETAQTRDAPIVVFGEIVGVLWSDGKHDAAVRLEELWNALREKRAFSLFCAYPLADMNRGSWQALHAVCGAHSHAVADPQHATSGEMQLGELCDLTRRARLFEQEAGQRKAAEQLLEMREHELSDFLENAPYGIHSVDADGVILWANRAELEMLGYARDEYIGHQIGESYLDPDGASSILERLRTGESLRDASARMRCKDGSVRDVQVTSNVRFDNGAFVRTRCFTRDVTGQLQAEQRLRETEERADRMQALCKAIVDSSDDAIVSKSLEGRVTSWNAGATRLFGYTAEEMIDKPITTIIPPELRHEEDGILAKLARGERIEHFETVRVTKDGRRLDVSLTISPVRDGRGQVVGASKVARDISERRRMEEKLRESDRRKDEFIAMLGHELRNPLAPIRNAAEVLRRTSAGNAQSEHLCLMLQRQVQQMTRLLDDLLDVSRITRGKIRFTRERVDLANVVQRAVEATRPLTDGRRHTLRVDLPQEVVHVDGDAARLVQMLTNLLNNAAKYTPEDGHITLRVARRNGDVELRVKDDGIGIQREVLASIFDLFVQAGRTAGAGHDGLGIGLTLVRMIAERHRGRVEARSDGAGRGSEFIVTLPAAAATDRSVSGGSPDASASPGVAARRIVIVDDNRDASESLATLLRLGGHHVSLAFEASTGLGLIETLRPDVALLDIGLPGMNGCEIARRLRASGCNVLLAAITGFGAPEDRERSREAGFDHHFVKPVDPQALERLIESIC
ncbi:MAG TPA: PAS domain S-box protein [Casimicrobiaceae bacterium]|nr:PAS domain S-box protein [Casimicrobiaceae bacterium]